jgi:hypothetical protein
MKTTLLTLIGCVLLSGRAFSQAPAVPNVVEIDPDIPVRLGWDYPLPNSNITGFKIYKKQVVNNQETWVLVGDRVLNNNPVALDLYLDLPLPTEGTYAVTAYNPEYESDYSDSITLIYKPVWNEIPLAPTNLRVIQVQ